jgi:hypothetical protein
MQTIFSYINNIVNCPIYSYMYTHTHAHPHMYRHTHTYTHIHTHSLTYYHIAKSKARGDTSSWRVRDEFVTSSWAVSYVHMCARVYAYTYIHTYIHACTYIYTHTYIHTYLYTYIHTYTYTYIDIHMDHHIAKSEAGSDEFVERGNYYLHRKLLFTYGSPYCEERGG